MPDPTQPEGFILRTGEIAWSGPEGPGYRHWHSLDTRFAQHISGLPGTTGLTSGSGFLHQHWPAVTHLHEYDYFLREGQAIK